MKLRLWPLISLLLSACGGSAEIGGTIADPDDATHVRYEGGPGTIPLADGAFAFGRVPGDTVDLFFERDGDGVGRMRLVGVPRGGEVELDAVWFDDGYAYPTEVRLSRGRLLEVNGIRMGGSERLPHRIDVTGSVLSTGRDGDALLIRPTDATLPDLRVVLVPASSVVGVDGEPARAERLEFGDSVRLVGRNESGYIIAEELILPRPGLSGEISSGSGGVSPPAPAGDGPRVAPRSSAESDSRVEAGEAGRGERDRRAVPARPGPNPGRGRGRRD